LDVKVETRLTPLTEEQPLGPIERGLAFEVDGVTTPPRIENATKESGTIRLICRGVRMITSITL
jgi:hypothetical protein